MADPKPPSTRFPFINLKKALERAESLYKAGRGSDVLVSDAFGIWEYSLKSSGGFQTVAAIKMYGLVTDSGTQDKRKLSLTPDALLYFRDERPEERVKLIKRFALKPALLSTLWNQWIHEPPADPIARSYLKIDLGLNEQAARSILGVYKENLRFANLKGDGKIPTETDDAEEEPPPPPSDPRIGQRIDLMEGERVLSDGLLSKTATYRLLVSGRIGPKEIGRLIQKLQFDREILADQEDDSGPSDN